MSVDLTRQSKSTLVEAPASRLVVCARFASIVRKLGFKSADQFLNLAGEVISGHRDRHVIETRLGPMRCFLKKEHRVPLSVKLRNWWEGFGPASMSEREARTLGELRAVGVPVPDCIAHGASTDGRSFLLLRHVPNSMSLARALEPGVLGHFERWQVARQLGAAIARIHKAGFDAPDLSLKHVLVRRLDRSVVLLDWPRARRIGTLDRNHCLHALAGLHASVATQFASKRERLLVLKVFLHTLGFHCPAAPIAREVLTIAHRMSQRRSIAEQTQSTVVSSQRLRWVNGEQLCVTRPLWRACGGNIPEWLREAAEKPSPWRTVDRVLLGTLGHGWLIQLPRPVWWRRWYSKLLRQPVHCHAVLETGLAFRMKRIGLPVCSVLAFGARPDGSGFLLVRSPRQFRGLREWLALPRPGRNKVVRSLGRILKKSHAAGCCGLGAHSLVVNVNKSQVPKLSLVPDGQWQRCRHLSTQQIAADIYRVAREFHLFDRRDIVRMIRSYMKDQPIAPVDLRLAHAVLHSHRGGRQ